MRALNSAVLLVDDDVELLNSASLALEAGGVEHVVTCADGREMESLLAQHNVGVILLDLNMPQVTGLELLERLVATYPEIPVIVVTGNADMVTAVRCLKLGAKDFLLKPVEPIRLVTTVRQILETRSLRSEYDAFKENVFRGRLSHPEAFASLITDHPDMLALFHYVEAIAATSWPVLITGETGTGKELIAQAIHRISQRDGKFVTVNAAAHDDPLFSDALFGHLRGAYTGADSARAGMLEAASHGTVFLDEIGDLSLASQVKLLRLLQDQSYYPVGADAARASSARVVLATNRDLAAAQRDGTFRKDLYYRLMTHHVRLPPLRQRVGDVPLLLAHFLEKAAAALGRPTPVAPPELAILLAAYDFPGNVREMEAMITDAVSQHPGRMLSMASFKDYLLQQKPEALLNANNAGPQHPFVFGDTLPTLKEAQELVIAEAMTRARDNQGIAAGLLGITRTALNKRLRK